MPNCCLCFEVVCVLHIIKFKSSVLVQRFSIFFNSVYNFLLLIFNCFFLIFYAQKESLPLWIFYTLPDFFCFLFSHRKVQNILFHLFLIPIWIKLALSNITIKTKKLNLRKSYPKTSSISMLCTNKHLKCFSWSGNHIFLNGPKNNYICQGKPILSINLFVLTLDVN